MPDGAPYALASFPGASMRYRCARCKAATLLSVDEFNTLPDLTLDQLRELGLADRMVLNDLRGQGLTDEQLAVLEAYGVDLTATGRKESV